MPSSLILFRTLDNAHFEINLYLGPKPQDIIQQIRADSSVEVPPYWSFGVHVCQNTIESNILDAIDNIEKLLIDNEVPFDSHCLHENLIEFGGNPLNIGLMDAVRNLKDNGKKILLSVISQVCNIFSCTNINIIIEYNHLKSRFLLIVWPFLKLQMQKFSCVVNILKFRMKV